MTAPHGSAGAVSVRLFAAARELAGMDECRLEIPDGAKAGYVLDHLESLAPRFRDWRPVIRLAVNREYVDLAHPLQDGDEVAVIPPVSGG